MAANGSDINQKRSSFDSSCRTAFTPVWENCLRNSSAGACSWNVAIGTVFMDKPTPQNCFGKSRSKLRLGDGESKRRVACSTRRLAHAPPLPAMQWFVSSSLLNRHGLEKSCAEMRRKFKLPFVPSDNAVLGQLRRELEECFSGTRKRLIVPLTLRGTGFQEQVWHELQRIPFGKTLSCEAAMATVSGASVCCWSGNVLAAVRSNQRSVQRITACRPC